MLKEVAGNSGAVPPHTVSPSRLTEIEEKCAMLENEKQHLETKLDVSNQTIAKTFYLFMLS